MASNDVANGSSAPSASNDADLPPVPGKVESAVLGKDDPIPDNLERVENKDVLSRHKGNADFVHPEEQEEEEAPPPDDDDLFGDGDDDEMREEAEELGEPKRKQLDDQELDSGDDEGRNDRAQSEPQIEEQERQLTYESGEIDRKPMPEPSDGEMYLLKVPNFLSIEPKMFHTKSFEPPTREHHSRKEPPPSFSAFNTAMSTIRWRHSPSRPEEIQSNARILRWSDGSLTLQMASNPTQQYAISGNALAPPQRNPVKPTPTSLKPGQKEPGGQQSYTYLTMPQPTVSLLRVTQRITAGLAVLPSESTTDEALEKLQNSLAASVQRKGKASNGNGSIEIVKMVEDPELARKQAEVAEKEKMRAQKRREAAETRNRDGRGAGRARGYGGGGGGLSTSLLEDDEMGAPRPRAKPKARKSAYNDEYSSDEDLGRRRGNFANDDYEVDDFVAGSDEEEEVAEESEEDVDEGIREEPRKESKRSQREEEDEDEDADGVDEDADAAPKAKRRRAVVDEDEDDE